MVRLFLKVFFDLGLIWVLFMVWFYVIILCIFCLCLIVNVIWRCCKILLFFFVYVVFFYFCFCFVDMYRWLFLVRYCCLFCLVVVNCLGLRYFVSKVGLLILLDFWSKIFMNLVMRVIIRLKRLMVLMKVKLRMV